MSLSPRPERQTSTVRARDAAAPSAARRRAHARSRAPAGCLRTRCSSRTRLERLVIAGGLVAHAPAGGEQRVLGTDAGIVEAGGHRVGLLDLAVLVLQQHGIGAVQHARAAVRQRRGVVARARAAAAGLDADDLDRLSSGTKAWKAPMELEPPPTQAMTASGSAPVALEHLRARLAADDRLQLAHQVGIRMRPDRRADADSRCRADRPPSRAAPRRWRRAASVAAGHRHDRRRRAGACGRRSAPGAPCRPRPCRPCTAGRGARRPRRSRRRAGPHRSRRRCASRPRRLASSAWPMALLILCAPVCARSSRFSQTFAPQRCREPRRRRSALSAGPPRSCSCRASSCLEVRRVQVLAHAALEPLERRNQGLGDVAAAEGTEAAARVREPAGDASRRAAARHRMQV